MTRKTLLFEEHENAALWHNPGLFGDDGLEKWRWRVFLFLGGRNGYEWALNSGLGKTVALSGPWHGDVLTEYTKMVVDEDGLMPMIADAENEKTDRYRLDSIKHRTKLEMDKGVYVPSIDRDRALAFSMPSQTGTDIAEALLELCGYLQNNMSKTVRLERPEDVDTIQEARRQAASARWSNR